MTFMKTGFSILLPRLRTDIQEVYDRIARYDDMRGEELTNFKAFLLNKCLSLTLGTNLYPKRVTEDTNLSELFFKEHERYLVPPLQESFMNSYFFYGDEFFEVSGRFVGAILVVELDSCPIELPF